MKCKVRIGSDVIHFFDFFSEVACFFLFTYFSVKFYRSTAFSFEVDCKIDAPAFLSFDFDFIFFGVSKSFLSFSSSSLESILI